MQPQPLQVYFFFGTCVRYLQDASAGLRIGDEEEGGMHIGSNLHRFFQYIKKLNLNVTRRHYSYSRLEHIFKELQTLPDNSILTGDQARIIKENMNAIRATLEAELSGISAYTLTSKRFDTALLIGNVHDLLTPGVYDKLPQIAQYDLREAGKCLAFERPTAAAFHLLRATEAVLRAFYSVLVKRGRRHTLWGPIIADLRKRQSAKSYGVLLDNLDNIRRSFRNPTQHPDATYDINEVQDLWGLCVDAINRMARALPDGKPA
jgi:hypothetical protein